MASPLANLFIRVGADTKDAVKGMTTLQRASRGLKDDFKRVSQSALTMRGAMTALAGAAGAAYAAKRIFDLGAAVGETASKFNTVFGPAVQDVNEFLDEFATMAGLSNREAQDLIATTGAIVQGFGFTREESAKLSTQVMALAGDFASFNNLPTADTSRAIQAALTGERESLKRLGVVILETEVQQRAMRDTGKTVAATLTQQEKAVASLALITEKAGVQIGDLTRTQSSAANRAKQLGAGMRDLRDDIAVGLQPAMNIFLELLGGSVGGMKELGDEFKEQAPVIAAWTKVAVLGVTTLGKALFAPVRMAYNLGTAFGNLVVAADEFGKGNFGKAREAFDRMKQDFGDIGDSILDVTEGMVDFGEAWNTALGTFRSTEVAAAVAAVDDEVKGLVIDMTALAPPSAKLLDGLVVLGDVGVTVFTDLRETVKPFKSLMQELGPAMAASFIDSALTMKFAFQDMVKDMMKQIARLAVKFAIFKGLQRLFPGSGFVAGMGKSFGFFDGGGRIGAGDFGIVGERGPELVQGPAMVTSRKDTAGMMGGDNVTNITIVGQSGEKLVDTITVRQRRNEKLGRVVRIPIPAAVVG